MKGRCASCKHWGDGECERVWGAYVGPNLYDFAPVHEGSKAYLSGYGDADLKTQPDFGCVMWEERECD